MTSAQLLYVLCERRALVSNRRPQVRGFNYCDTSPAPAPAPAGAAPIEDVWLRKRDARTSSAELERDVAVSAA